MDLRTPECDALVLAADESALVAGATLRTRWWTSSSSSSSSSDAWPLIVVDHPGDALRHVLVRRPKLLFVCVTTERLEAASALVAAVSRRRDGRPLVGLALTHDEAVEAAVRIAGATHYVALDVDGDGDGEQLDRLLRDAGIPPPDTVGTAPPGRAPPWATPPPPASSRRPRNRSRPSHRM